MYPRSCLRLSRLASIASPRRGKNVAVRIRPSVSSTRPLSFSRAALSDGPSPASSETPDSPLIRRQYVFDKRGWKLKESPPRFKEAPSPPTGPSRGRFSVIARHGKAIEVQELLPHFEKVDPSLLRSPESLSIVIFATIGQRHLISPESGLIQGIISRLFSPGGVLSDYQHVANTIPVITGIVDRIGVPEFNHTEFYGIVGNDGAADDQGRYHRVNMISGAARITRFEQAFGGEEGVAIDLSLSAAEFQKTHDGTANANGIYSVAPGNIAFGVNARSKPLLTRDVAFRIHSPRMMTVLSLSLAATKMQTGTDFVLRRQRWAWDPLETKVVLLLDEKIQSAVFTGRSSDRADANKRNTAFEHKSGGGFFHPITPLRRVHSSLGNVIRSFEGEGQEDGATSIIPASQELEKIMPKARLDLINESSSGIEIWAAASSSENQHWYAAAVETGKSLAQRGFSMFRVHGGGGGWEGKGGPITLDIDDDSEKLTDGMEEEAFDEWKMERYLSGASARVKPGDVVQFYLVGLTKAHPAFSSRSRSGVTRKYPAQIRSALEQDDGRGEYLLGALPSAADRVKITAIEEPSTILSTFGILAEHATLSFEGHEFEPGYDHGAERLGRLHKTRIPPLCTFLLETNPARKPKSI